MGAPRSGGAGGGQGKLAPQILTKTIRKRYENEKKMVQGTTPPLLPDLGAPKTCKYNSFQAWGYQNLTNTMILVFGGTKTLQI